MRSHACPETQSRRSFGDCARAIKHAIFALTLAGLPVAAAQGQAPAQIDTGTVATPSLTLQSSRGGDGAVNDHALRFGSYEPIAEGQTWVLQRGAGDSWQQVYRGPATTYPLALDALPGQFRLSTCRGTDNCSGFSLPVSVTLTPTDSPLTPVVTLTPTWSNPDVVGDGAACPADPAPAASDWVGRIAGAAAVDTGTASYSLPIEVPPGRSGMQPAVSLVYSSTAGQGVAGVGWSLSASSSIRRCPRTVARDGVAQPVLIDSVDRLCLDGSPLILESGANGYGGNGAVYRSELNKLDRVRQINNSTQVTGNLHACFEVRTKSGLIRRYGRCADPAAQAFEQETLLDAANQPVTFTVGWLLAREEDQQGNFVDYRYDWIDGRPYLREIVYTGRAGVPGNRRVVFEYLRRPDFDLGFEFRGVERRLTQLLRGVSTYVDSTLVRRYELEHRKSAATGRSLLRSVTVCDDDTYDAHRPWCVPYRSLPPTRFAYQEEPPEEGYEYERVPLLSHATGWQESTSDFDGDGTKDKFEITLESPRSTVAAVTDAELVLSNNGSPLRFPLVSNGSRVDLVPGFRDASEANIHRYRHIYNLKLPIDGDLDQDGRSDLLGVANGVLAIASWNGSQFVVSESNVPVAGSGSDNLRLLDFNADGKTDILQFGTVHLQCAAPPSGPGVAALQFCDSFPLDFGWPIPNGHRLTMVQDFNGDGLPDFLFDTLSECESSAWGNPDGVAPNIFMSTGVFSTNVAQSYQRQSLAYIDPLSLFAKDEGIWPECRARRTFRIGDFNGDGLTDLVKVGTVALELWINHAGQFVEYSHNAGAFALRDAVLARAAVIADFDHDGSDEILVPVANAWTYSRLVSDPQNADIDDFMSDGTGQPPYDDGRSDFWTAAGSLYQDRGLYRWDALDVTFDTTSPGTATVTRRETNFVGAQYRSAFQDWSDDGLAHGVIYIDPEFGAACAAPTPRGGSCSLASAISDYLTSAGTQPGYCEEGIPIVETANCPPTAPIGTYDLPPWAGGYAGETITVVQNGIGRTYNVPAGSGQFVARQTAGHPDLLIEVVDGLGQTAHWRYAPLSSDGDPSCDSPRNIPFYTASYGATPRDGIHSLFTSAKLVVSRFSLDNGTGSENHSCYRYEDAWWNNQGRGFLGFSRVIAEQDIPGAAADDANDLRTETTYETRFPLAGSVCDSKTFLASDPATTALSCAVASGGGGGVPTPGPVPPIRWTATVWRSNCAFDVSRPAGEAAQSCFVYADRTHEESFDLASRSSIAVKITDPTYVGTGLMRGNPSTVETIVSDAVQQQRTMTTYAYNYSAPATAWWINRLERVTVDAEPIGYVDGSLSSEPPKRVVTRYEYFPDAGPASRLVSGEYLQESVSEQWHQTLYEYDPFGNLRFARESADAAAARTSEIRYTSDGYFKSWSSNPEGHWREYAFEPATGLQSSERDQDGRRWTRSYGPLGRLITETAPGVPAAHHRVWRCDASCAPLAAYRVARYQGGAPTTVQQLDRLDRTLREQAAAFGSPSTQWVTVDRTFAPRGYLVRQYEPGLLPAVPPVYAPLWTAATRFESFDALGRVGRKVVEKPDLPFTEMATSYTYDGLTTKITLPGGLLASRGTDSSGRYVTTTDARGSVVKFRYDALGGLALIEDPKGNQTRATYDALRRITAMEDPDRGIHVFAYDGYGLLRGRIDGRGSQLIMRYDRLGRIVERDVDGVRQSGWSYDTSVTGALDSEFPLTIAVNDFRRDFDYDSAGRVTQTTTTIDQRTFVVNHGYDCDGRPVATRYPSGKEVGFAYTDAGHLRREDDYGYLPGAPAKMYRTITGMSSRGAVIAESFGNGTRGTYRFYDSTGQARLRIVNGPPPSNSEINNVSYFYGDAFANLTLQDNTRLRVAETYLYDDLQRLYTATRTWPNRPTRIIDYRYDDVGNFTSKSDYALGYGYGDATRSGPSHAGPNGMRSYVPLNGPAVADFSYDANGNLLVGDGRTTVYDAFNYPTQVTYGGNTVHFTYAPSRERVKKVEGATTTYYVEDKLYEHVEDAAGVMTMRHYIGPSVLATLERPPAARFGTETVRYLHLDRLGSIETITDGLGAVTEPRHAYDPFGAPRNGSNWTENAWVRSPSATPRGFTAHEHVDSQRVIHMNGRAFDYRLARFLSPDPFVVEPLNIQSHNPYSYVLNNPYSGTDPTGFQTVVEGEGCMRFDRLECHSAASTETGKTTSTTTNTNTSTAGVTRNVPPDDRGVAMGDVRLHDHERSVREKENASLPNYLFSAADVPDIAKVRAQLASTELAAEAALGREVFKELGAATGTAALSAEEFRASLLVDARSFASRQERTAAMSSTEFNSHLMTADTGYYSLGHGDPLEISIQGLPGTHRTNDINYTGIGYMYRMRGGTMAEMNAAIIAYNAFDDGSGNGRSWDGIRSDLRQIPRAIFWAEFGYRTYPYLLRLDSPRNVK